jgi:hypothetical protein
VLREGPFESLATATGCDRLDQVYIAPSRRAPTFRHRRAFMVIVGKGSAPLTSPLTRSASAAAVVRPRWLTIAARTSGMLR